MPIELVVPAVSGAAASLVTLLAKSGVDWIVEIVKAQSPEVQRQIQQNSQRFLDRLARRVETLEAELPGSRRSIFEEASLHPGTALLMRRAFVTAGSTASDDRHELLSELIAARLAAGEDDMIALAGGAACDVVSALSARQLRLLAVAATIFKLRPVEPPDISMGVAEALRDPELAEFLRSTQGTQLSGIGDAPTLQRVFTQTWWDKSLAPLCDASLAAITMLDIDHLAALSCASLLGGFVARPSLLELLSTRVWKDLQIDEESFRRFGWWEPLSTVYENGLSHLNLTSVGNLIGTLHHDAQTGRRTRIPWDDPPGSRLATARR